MWFGERWEGTESGFGEGGGKEEDEEDRSFEDDLEEDKEVKEEGKEEGEETLVRSFVRVTSDTEPFVTIVYSPEACCTLCSLTCYCWWAPWHARPLWQPLNTSFHVVRFLRASFSRISVCVCGACCGVVALYLVRVEVRHRGASGRGAG